MSCQSVFKIKVEKYKIIILGALVFASPFLLFPTGYKVLALLVLPVILIIHWYTTSHFIARTPFDWSILLMLIMVLVSLWATPDINYSIGKIAGLLLGIVLYYLVVSLANTEASLQVALWSYIFVSAGLVVASVLGMQQPEKFAIFQPIVHRIPDILSGVSGADKGFNPNQVGGVLIFFLPLEIFMLISYTKKSISNVKEKSTVRNGETWLPAILLSVFVFVTGGVLLLTQSRGALGGLVVGLVFVFALRTYFGKIVAFTGMIALVFAVRSGIVDQLVSPSGVNTAMAGTISLNARIEIWERAIYGLTDFPFTGMGMNMFRRVMPMLYPTNIIPSTMDIAHAHNHLLQAGLDLGIPGLIAYLSLWIGLSFLLYRVIFYSHNQWLQELSMGLLSGFIAHFVYGMTDAVALGAKPGFVFWWALGLTVSIYKLDVNGQTK